MRAGKRLPEHKTWLIVPFLAFCIFDAAAQPPGVEISGFGDVYYSARRDSGENPFTIGQLELDVKATVTRHVSVSAAFALDSATRDFRVGEYFMEFRLFGIEENHLRPTHGITHSGALVGQFDVPFGIDWEFYASIDRKLVTVPLVVEAAHGMWNDAGVQVHASNNYFRGAVYVVNGFEYDDIRTSYAVGGRLGVKPLPFLEFGGSYAGFVREGGIPDMHLFGGDVRLDWYGLLLKGEYITRREVLAGGVETVSFGYYGEGLYRFGRLFVVARNDYFKSALANGIIRTSLGAGWTIANGCEMRLEYQLRPDEQDDVSFLQVAAGF